MKIVYLDAFPLGTDIDLNPLTSLGEYVSYDRSTIEEAKERIKDAEIILTNKCTINGELMDAAPKLKYIGVTATGYNIIDTKAATERGIIVTNASDYSSNSVAQHVFSLIFYHLNQVHSYQEKQEWTKAPDFCYFNHVITEVCGKTLGVIGFGGIGKKVVSIAEAFGMNILINRRKIDTDDSRMVNLEKLLNESDFISLHLPLTNENQQMVDNSFLKQMKPTSMLINTARGGLINEDDLAKALNEDKIAAAGLDVLSTEPPHPSNPLLKAKNCIITPHVAWGSYEARKKLLEIVVDNIKAFQKEHPQNVVN